MSKLDERVLQLKNGIIRRLNNPEGLPEEEVDALIFYVQEQIKERLREASDYSPILGTYAILPSSLLAPTKDATDGYDTIGAPPLTAEQESLEAES